MGKSNRKTVTKVLEVLSPADVFLGGETLRGVLTTLHDWGRRYKDYENVRFVDVGGYDFEQYELVGERRETDMEYRRRIERRRRYLRRRRVFVKSVR